MSDERRQMVREISQTLQQALWRHRHDIMSHMADRGLTALQYSALSILDQQGPALPIGAIGEGMLTPASSMTSVVDRLVDLGLVERVPHPTDRRAVLVRITAAGRDLVRNVEEQRLETMLDRLAGLSAAELAHFLARLRQIAN